MTLKEKIKALAALFSQDLIHHRRHIHAYPELSFEEHETSAYVENLLRSYGIEKIEKKANTGLVALIEGVNPAQKTLALRADIDALPIFESNETSYKSTKPGIMHACGHDVHTASLLGVARILQELKEDFSGTVKLIFQPGEEKIPGGASLMIRDGALENPTPNAIIGQHVMPLIDVGKVGFRKGMYMASADELYLTVKGKGGHGAMPENLVDPVLIASHIIVALQQVISRNASPKIPSVLSFGRIEALGATNIIPNEVKIEGTFRTLDEEWRAKAHTHMVKIATGIAEGMGGSVDFEVRKGYPFLKNADELTERLRQFAVDYLGADKVEDLDIWMAAEDFSYYTQALEGCFYRLGTRNESKGITSGVHTPNFDIDEDALEVGAGLMAYLAIQELSSNI
ncbi:M20 metallopeptidase family protein [Pararhodonellum marinum]|uniref:M20 metallopeptidase family protein n=1 Tax=Pararhodonellum marinum TaxID=2755358 RepID=UPI001890AB0C|nr:M20 family metallopeptidase [Pararhodonellum marinum]